MWELGASCSLLVLWAISWSLPHHELPPLLPAPCLFPLVPQTLLLFLLCFFVPVNSLRSGLPAWIGGGRSAKKTFALLPPLTSSPPEKAYCCQPLALSRTFHSSSRDPPPPAPKNKIIFSAVYPCGPLKLLLLPGNGSLRCLFPSVLLSGARLSWICY